jgi:hypothetical protein
MKISMSSGCAPSASIFTLHSPENENVTNGILLALLAFASYSCSGAAIKKPGWAVHGVFSTLFASFLSSPGPNGERWRDFWRTERPLAVRARARTGVWPASRLRGDRRG